MGHAPTPTRARTHIQNITAATTFSSCPLYRCCLAPVYAPPMRCQNRTATLRGRWLWCVCVGGGGDPLRLRRRLAIDLHVLGERCDHVAEDHHLHHQDRRHPRPDRPRLQPPRAHEVLRGTRQREHDREGAGAGRGGGGSAHREEGRGEHQHRPSQQLVDDLPVARPPARGAARPLSGRGGVGCGRVAAGRGVPGCAPHDGPDALWVATPGGQQAAARVSRRGAYGGAVSAPLGQQGLGCGGGGDAPTRHRPGWAARTTGRTWPRSRDVPGRRGAGLALSPGRGRGRPATRNGVSLGGVG